MGTSATVRLGAFELGEPLSVGGMGRVWRAVHERTGTTVAVKLVNAHYARDPAYIEVFEQEVRAVARMDHPGIVDIFDYGTATREAERASHGAIVAGTPWLAMELSRRGSLADVGGFRDWTSLKLVLLDILDALAHSHARRVIHRDLKPANVLMFGVDHLRCKLTDFGIAHTSTTALATHEVFASSAGTPWYMAPEQIQGRWRDFGPWTDLYALGCLAYELACGAPPFNGPLVEIARQHLHERPPALRAPFAVASGFQRWIDRLLGKEVDQRFGRAADAAWALHQLEDPAESSPTLDEPTDVDESRRDRNARAVTLTMVSAEVPLVEMRLSSHCAAASPTVDVPPMVNEWRPAQHERAPALAGAGVGLVQLREVPFVGRTGERDQMWNTLADVVRRGEPRVIVVTGDTGVGKSRLCRWVAERAHELGVTTNLFARHQRGDAGGQGFATMLAELFCCPAMDASSAHARILAAVSRLGAPAAEAAHYATALTAIVAPDGSSHGPAFRFANDDERLDVVLWLVGRMAGHRPVLLVFDDVHDNYDAISLAKRALSTPNPVLILLTAREERRPDRPLESDALRDLLGADGVALVELAPLDPKQQGKLLDELLDLRDDLRQEVLQRTLGSPLFAAELLGDWIQRGLLRDGGDGFCLAPGASFPATLDALWGERLDRALRLLPDADAARAAVEMGAVLGATVVTDEWLRACGTLGIVVDLRLLSVLRAYGFIETEDGSWTFRHSMLRDAILGRVRERGSAPTYHRTAAALLEHDSSADGQFRRALHFIAMEDFRGAIGPLLHATKLYWSIGRGREAAAIPTLIDEAARHLPADDPLQAAAIESRCYVLHFNGDFDGLVRWAGRQWPLAEKRGWWKTVAVLAEHLGIALLAQGERAEAVTFTERGLEFALRSGSARVAAYLRLRLGDLYADEGAAVRAEVHTTAALEYFRTTGDRAGEAAANRVLTEIALGRRDHAAAIKHSEEALVIAREAGLVSQLPNLLMASGDVALLERRYDEAAEAYEEARALATLGVPHWLPLTEFNCAIAKLYLGRAEEARELLERCASSFERRSEKAFVFYAGLAQLWCAAELGDVAAWDAAYDPLLRDASPDLAHLQVVDYLRAAAEAWGGRDDSPRRVESERLAEKLSARRPGV